MDSAPRLGDKSTAGDTGLLVARVNVTFTTSPTVTPTTLGGGFDAIADTIPSQHSTAPSLLPSSGEHAAHSVDAGDEVNVPAEHRVQSSSDELPFRALYRPGGHGCCAPPGQKCPGKQAMAVLLTLPSGHKCPREHGPEHDRFVKPAVSPYRPSGHRCCHHWHEDNTQQAFMLVEIILRAQRHR